MDFPTFKHLTELENAAFKEIGVRLDDVINPELRKYVTEALKEKFPDNEETDLNDAYEVAMNEWVEAYCGE